MYIPGTNRFTDEEEIFRFLHAHPFAIIVSNGPDGITATHTPVEIEPGPDGEPIIRSHMARANPQWRSFADDNSVMVIFNGPHTYISSSWYDHVNVPTWNYIAVHVYGKPRILNGDDSLAMLHRLVSRYEQQPGHRFSIDQMSQTEIDSHLQALVAFEISIDRIDAKAKLSQNRDAHNFDRIIDALGNRADADSKLIRDEMEKLRGKLG